MSESNTNLRDKARTQLEPLTAQGFATGISSLFRTRDISPFADFQFEKDGTKALYLYSYDASAASGNRFTEHPYLGTLDMPAAIQFLGGLGDGILIGSTEVLSNVLTIPFIAKNSGEMMDASFWHDSAMVPVDYQVFDQNAKSLNNELWEQDQADEIIHFDVSAANTFDGADKTNNVLDKLPNTGVDLYWYQFTNSVALTIAPKIGFMSIKVDGVSYLPNSGVRIMSGRSRVNKNALMNFDLADNPWNVDAANVALTPTHNRTFYTLRRGQNDTVPTQWMLPHGIDTSSKARISLNLLPKTNIAADTSYKVDVVKLRGGIPLPVASDATLVGTIVNTNGDPYLDFNMGEFSIADLKPCDTLSFNLTRTDNNGPVNNIVYPLAMVIHYFNYSDGELKTTGGVTFNSFDQKSLLTITPFWAALALGFIEATQGLFDSAVLSFRGIARRASLKWQEVAMLFENALYKKVSKVFLVVLTLASALYPVINGRLKTHAPIFLEVEEDVYNLPIEYNNKIFVKHENVITIGGIDYNGKRHISVINVGFLDITLTDNEQKAERKLQLIGNKDKALKPGQAASFVYNNGEWHEKNN